MTDTRSRRRAVVTGQGMVTPLGRTPEELWSAWAESRVAAAPLRCKDFDFFNIHSAARVQDFEPRKEIKNRKLLRLMIDGETFGFVAASTAFENAGLTPEDYLPERAGVVIGCHKEGFRDENLYDALDAATRDDGTIDRERLIEDGIRRIPPQTLVEGLANAALYYLAHQFVLQGANQNFISSGSGGMLAIGEAMRSIRRGEADLMLCGGYDTWMDWRCIGHQRYIDALSIADGPPQDIHRPFDRDRTGGIAGEGAGMVILEDRERALARNAEVLGEVEGFAVGMGVGEGEDPSLVETYACVIRRALDDAGCTPEQIDVIHLQGEGSLHSDRLEVLAVQQALGESANQIPATTIKSCTGLLGNASGPVEAVMALQMFARGAILPIANLHEPDPQLSLNFVRAPIVDRSLRRGLLLQRSWPHHYSALVLSTGAE